LPLKKSSITRGNYFDGQASHLVISRGFLEFGPSKKGTLLL
jgi:hypothetical protein